MELNGKNQQPWQIYKKTLPLTKKIAAAIFLKIGFLDFLLFSGHVVAKSLNFVKKSPRNFKIESERKRKGCIGVGRVPVPRLLLAFFHFNF
jgi:hypothetical protein